MMIRHLLAALLACAALPALAGDIEIGAPFARAVPEGVRASAAYMTIANHGATDDRLVAARADFAARVELHEHRMENGVARMREVEGGILAPAGETVTLEPGGLHVMLMGLDGPLAEGDSVSITLVFEQAGEIAVIAPVRRQAPMAHGGHGGMKAGQ
jgi:copper(I)-binding protein